MVYKWIKEDFRVKRLASEGQARCGVDSLIGSSGALLRSVLEQGMENPHFAKRIQGEENFSSALSTFFSAQHQYWKYRDGKTEIPAPPTAFTELDFIPPF